MAKAKVIPLKPPTPQYEELSPQDADQLMLGLIVITKTVHSRAKCVELCQVWLASQGAKLVQQAGLDLNLKPTVDHLRRQKRKGQYVLHWRALEGYHLFSTLTEAAKYLHMNANELRKDFSTRDRLDVVDGTDNHGNPEHATLELVPFDQLTDRLKEITAEGARG